MKALKKLAGAVAVAAVCCAMIVPTVTHASTCPPHHYKPVLVDQYIGGVDVSTHEYLHAVIEHVDGTTTYDYRDCRVDIMVYVYDLTCEGCQDVEGTEYSQKYYHNSCGLGIVGQ